MRICVPIRSNNLSNVISRAEVAKGAGVDLVEIWLDQIEFFDESLFDATSDFAYTFETIGIPVLAVCKGEDEKGNFSGSEVQRIGRLKSAIEAGAQFVDVGVETEEELIKEVVDVAHENGTAVIISYHNFEVTPEVGELKEVVDKAILLGADVVKLATNAVKDSDNEKVLEALDYVLAQGKKGLAMCMSTHGIRSRIEAVEKGAEWIFAAIDENSKTAPGQLTIEEVKNSIL